jgi:hypothetical protein
MQDLLQIFSWNIILRSVTKNGKIEQGQLSRLGSRSPSFQGFAVDTLCYALASATPIKTLGGILANRI